MLPAGITRRYKLADDGVPSVTYPRATWRLQAEQEAVPVCEEEKTEPFVFRTAFMT